MSEDTDEAFAPPELVGSRFDVPWPLPPVVGDCFEGRK